MQHIYTIGETVYDIIFKDGRPMAAKAGGSLLNATVSLGRLGLPVHFISEYATDEIGNLIDSFLKENSVDTQFVYRHKTGKTSISIATLDTQSNASYSFYKEIPSERLQINFPIVQQNDIVMFGSFFAINSEIRKPLVDFLKYAKSQNAILIYDPNYRKAHLHELNDLLPFIIENISLADIVRGSREDFELIFNFNYIEQTYNKINLLCPIFICTASKSGVSVCLPTAQRNYHSLSIKPISTIGAGDTFNAGLAFGLNKNNITHASLQNISINMFDQIIPTAIDMATMVCMSYDNYISVEFAQKINL